MRMGFVSSILTMVVALAVVSLMSLPGAAQENTEKQDKGKRTQEKKGPPGPPPGMRLTSTGWRDGGAWTRHTLV
jgi:hypothetical protein